MLYEDSNSVGFFTGNVQGPHTYSVATGPSLQGGFEVEGKIQVARLLTEESTRFDPIGPNKGSYLIPLSPKLSGRLRSPYTAYNYVYFCTSTLQ